MPRELTADERQSHAALQHTILCLEKCILDIGHPRVDAPGTKCLVPDDIIDSLNDYITEMKHTQECILVLAGEEDIAEARLDAVRYEQDYERGCDA